MQALLAADPEAVLACAEAEGVAPLLARALPAQAPTAALRARLAAQARLDGMRLLAREASARAVLDQLAEAGLPCFVLKGMALGQWLYPAPELRPGCDIDLLVADLAQAEAATAALVAAGWTLAHGVAPRQASDTQVALVDPARRGVVLDLHWRLLNHAGLDRGLAFADLWARAQALPGLHPQARALGAADALLHAALHRAGNRAAGTHDRLLWLYDVHLLAARCGPGDWARLLAPAADPVHLAALVDALQAAHAAFATALPPELAEAAARSAGAGLHLDAPGAFDRSHLRGLPWPQRLRWLWHKLLPPPAFMRHRYDAHGPLGLAAAYLRRWGVGLRRALGADR
nr:nucleotidyltransferase family protein [Thermomonas flagellata]